MHSPLRFLAPLTVLVAALVLGAGGRARADFISPVRLADAAPSTGSLGGGRPGGCEEPAGDGASAQANDPDHGQSAQRTAGRLQLRLLRPAGDAFGPESGGAGSQPSPTDAGGAGAAPTSAPAARSLLEAPALAGVLRLESASRRAPPVPSPLFRPPRLS